MTGFTHLADVSSSFHIPGFSLIARCASGHPASEMASEYVTPIVYLLAAFFFFFC